MKVVWSRRAAEHLNAIRDYIEQDNSDAAERIAQRIRETAGQEECWAPGSL
jgi:plasmid stabilization system protein ParE